MTDPSETYDGYDEYMEYLEEEYDMEEETTAPLDTENIDIIKKQDEYIRDRHVLETMSDALDKKAKEVFPKEKTYRSLLLKYFTPDVCIALEKIRRTFSVSPAQKEIEMKKVLTSFGIPYEKGGIGTNRCAVRVDKYIVKIACDVDGMIDNKREFLYSLALQPYVVRTYECSPTGLLSVCEYVESLHNKDFEDAKLKEKMRTILKKISSQFFIGDVGITDANYGNWGRRPTTNELVILDYAYIYSVAFNLFQCTCKDKGTLYYDRDFVKLVCPICNTKFTFGEMRKRISRQNQDKEIGDIKTKGYLLKKPVEKKAFNHRFVLGATDTLVEELEKDRKRAKKREEKEAEKIPENFQSYDTPETKDISSVINKYCR